MLCPPKPPHLTGFLYPTRAEEVISAVVARGTSRHLGDQGRNVVGPTRQFSTNPRQFPTLGPKWSISWAHKCMPGVVPYPPTLRRPPTRIPRALPALCFRGNVVAPIILGNSRRTRLAEWRRGVAVVTRVARAGVSVSCLRGFLAFCAYLRLFWVDIVALHAQRAG